MDKKEVIRQIKEGKIIAIVRGIALDKIEDTCRALHDGGISNIEVTFDQSSPTGNDDTFKAIKCISDNLPEINVGAGTVMTEEQVELAVAAGAGYIISPNFDRKVMEKTKALGAVSIPGVLTPSEVTDAYNAGADFAKLFPAGVFGLGYIKAMKAPINHIPMLGVGGVDSDNIRSFMEIGLEGVGVGSSLVNRQLINEGRFQELKELAVLFVKNMKGE